MKYFLGNLEVTGIIHDQLYFTGRVVGKGLDYISCGIIYKFFNAREGGLYGQDRRS